MGHRRSPRGWKVPAVTWPTACMPKDVFDKNHVYLPHTDLLSFEEITRVARLFVEHGVEKIRLTGGEPLLRKNIESLIAMLAALRTPSGQPLDLTLTTSSPCWPRCTRRRASRWT